MKRHVRIIVRGRVQGVFFRDYTRQQAERLSLSGTVRNLRSGDVEIDAQGTPNNVDALLEWCWKGSPMSAVKAVEVENLPENSSLSSFSILY